MKHIITTSGFECDIDPACLDDFELFDAIVALQNGDVLQTPTVVSKILGEQKKTLYNFLRNDEGRVPTLEVSRVITEILEGLNEKK